MTNEELTEQLALDLGLGDVFTRRMPYAKEVFKKFDLDLLPHSSEDTCLGEIYENSGRNWRTTNNNLVGFVATPESMAGLMAQLSAVQRMNANIPDFEFTKDDLVGVGVEIPKFLNFKLKGNVSSAKDIRVTMTGVKKARLTNTSQPGTELARLVSEYAENHTKKYRQHIKHDHIAVSLFYVEQMELVMEKHDGVNLDVGVEIDGVPLNASVETSSEKKYKLSYNGNGSLPFAATFVRGKELF
jgi:hypothetical protein